MQLPKHNQKFRLENYTSIKKLLIDTGLGAWFGDHDMENYYFSPNKLVKKQIVASSNNKNQRKFLPKKDLNCENETLLSKIFPYEQKFLILVNFEQVFRH